MPFLRACQGPSEKRADRYERIKATEMVTTKVTATTKCKCTNASANALRTSNSTGSGPENKHRNSYILLEPRSRVENFVGTLTVDRLPPPCPFIMVESDRQLSLFCLSFLSLLPPTPWDPPSCVCGARGGVSKDKTGQQKNQRCHV